MDPEVQAIRPAAIGVSAAVAAGRLASCIPESYRVPLICTFFFNPRRHRHAAAHTAASRCACAHLLSARLTAKLLSTRTQVSRPFGWFLTTRPGAALFLRQCGNRSDGATKLSFICLGSRGCYHIYGWPPHRELCQVASDLGRLFCTFLVQPRQQHSKCSRTTCRVGLDAWPQAGDSQDPGAGVLQGRPD